MGGGGGVKIFIVGILDGAQPTSHSSIVLFSHFPMIWCSGLGMVLQCFDS